TYTCAVKADGTLWCWGSNGCGQLGDGTTQDKSSPVQVLALGTSAVAVAAGCDYTCAVKADGTLWCWGYNYYGQLGDGTTQDKSLPVEVKALGKTVAAVAVGERHTCAVKTGGTLWCWGYNGTGQLGDGTTQDKTSPVQVMALGGCK
ncbi:MAG: RCC1 repeat-containing protein, partial [Deltaproteobacteria bacterium]|nr:RCC1 repeat-containing protein [Deltaproteobacteria bacterium]